MPLGTRIRKAREQARISQAELARRIGISKTAMNAIEGGATDPRASRIVAIAQVLGVSTDALLLGTAATGKRQHKPPALIARAERLPSLPEMAARLEQLTQAIATLTARVHELEQECEALRQRELIQLWETDAKEE